MYKHVNAIVERKYYYDDSQTRHAVKQNYYKYDIACLYANTDKDAQPNVPEETDYQKLQQVWQYILNKEPDNTKKNIFYLYYYERKRQEEIAYLLEKSQAYIVKVLHQMVDKLNKYFYELKGCEANGQLLFRFDEI